MDVAHADVVDTAPEEWRYISEGGATIVFSYAGRAHHQFDGMALRLRKVPWTTIPNADRTVRDECDDPSIEFQHTVMSRLIPAEHLPCLKTVHVNKDWLEALDADRPLKRRAEDHIDVSRRKAVLATDLVGGAGLAVEIRPKWAFLPASHHLSPSTLPIKSTVCRFCMHSNLKSSSDALACPGYCPLDLCSGERVRVTKAVHALWDAWLDSRGQVNNMRIFVHGKMVKPKGSGSVANDLSGERSGRSMTEVREDLITSVVNFLLSTRILPVLAQHQRALDALDMEGLSKLWNQSRLELAEQPPSRIGSTMEDPTLTEWTKFLDDYLSSHHLMDHSQPTTQNLRYYLQAYLLSATLKDCSIILRFDRGLDEPQTSQRPRDGSITVINLDPKSMRRLWLWEKLDRRTVEICMGVEEKRTCVDNLLP